MTPTELALDSDVEASKEPEELGAWPGGHKETLEHPSGQMPLVSLLQNWPLRSLQKELLHQNFPLSFHTGATNHQSTVQSTNPTESAFRQQKWQRKRARADIAQ